MGTAGYEVGNALAYATGVGSHAGISREGPSKLELASSRACLSSAVPVS